jgi:hypothetical protein
MSQREQVAVDCLVCLQPPAHAGLSLSDFVYTEDGGDTFLRNVR